MTAVKITNFVGIAPKISPELLPDNAAQVAYNTKLDSGDLVPYKESTRIGDTYRRAGVRTLYTLHDEQGNPVWLSWGTDVDIVEASNEIDDEQRFYYTGDGAPKVSTYKLATSGSAPYPHDYYDLGLPLPFTRLTATAASSPSARTSSKARDSGNYATLTTQSPHGLRTGNTISVFGMPTATSSVATFNVTNTKVTVIDDYTISYYSPGEVVGSTGDTSGTVSLAGNTFSRTYVYTWFTPWEEESIPSDPSDSIYLKEGQTVTVSNLPQAAPVGKTYVRGMRVYRTVNSSSSAAYMLLATLWFPVRVVACQRKSNRVYVITDIPHFLIAGDRFCITGSTNAAFNTANGEVETVVDKTTFVFRSDGADIELDTTSGGYLYHNCAPLTSDTPRFWGLNGYDFIDDYDVDTLSTQLDSEGHDAPPEGLQGLTLYTQGIYVGFVGNQVFFSDKDKPYSWPAEYALTLDANIVGLCTSGIYLVVLTDDSPYVVSGSNPKTMSYMKIDFPYPCLSKKSIVQMGYGVAYATHGGIALYNPSAGASKLTQYVHSYDTWQAALDPTTIVAVYHEDKYIASHSTGAFCFDKDPDSSYSRMTGKGNQLGGTMVSLSLAMKAGYVDQKSGYLYYVTDDYGFVYKWDDRKQLPMTQEWKSKVIVTKDYMNLGAARVIADYVDEDIRQSIIEYNQGVSEYNAFFWERMPQIAPINGPVDYTLEDGTSVSVFGTFNAYPINGDPVLRYSKNEQYVYPVSFRLWRNKELVFQANIGNSDIFRLPTGFRTDTFEVAVSSSVRIRAVHIGETPFGLRNA